MTVTSSGKSPAVPPMCSTSMVFFPAASDSPGVLGATFTAVVVKCRFSKQAGAGHGLEQHGRCGMDAMDATGIYTVATGGNRVGLGAVCT